MMAIMFDNIASSGHFPPSVLDDPFLFWNPMLSVIQFFFFPFSIGKNEIVWKHQNGGAGEGNPGALEVYKQCQKAKRKRQTTKDPPFRAQPSDEPQ